MGLYSMDWGVILGLWGACVCMFGKGPGGGGRAYFEVGILQEVFQQRHTIGINFLFKIFTSTDLYRF